MFEEKCYKFGLDYTRFVRNYYLDKVKKGERINQDDLKYVFIECNLQLTECIEIFNVSYSKLRSDLKHFNIVKSPLLQQKNREKNCIKKYNVINPSCLNEVKEKRKQTNIKRYGYANSSMNVEIKQKIQETMQKRYGGNAPACDPKILEKIKKTNLEKYGEEWAWKTEEGKKKQKDACVAKYGVNNPMLLPEIQEKAKLTKLKKYGRTDVGQFGTEEHNKAIKEKYGVNYIAQNKELSNKIKKTVENKYGVKCILSLEKNKEKAKNAIITKYGTNCTFNVPEIRDKANKNRTKWRESSDYIEIRKAMTERCWETKKRNNTCNTSKAEETIFEMLSNKFKDVKRNYKCDLYPFHCDFYIVDLDIYIEYQGSWVHGKKPYDENDFDCITLLKKWKVKSLEINYKKEPKNYYRNAIHVWTVSDPLKRKVAKDNNLNWKEFWNIQEVKDWITTLK